MDPKRVAQEFLRKPVVVSYYQVQSLANTLSDRDKRREVINQNYREYVDAFPDNIMRLGVVAKLETRAEDIPAFKELLDCLKEKYPDLADLPEFLINCSVKCMIAESKVNPSNPPKWSLYMMKDFDNLCLSWGTMQCLVDLAEKLLVG